ncbi:globin domain-containing protein [Pilimelia columellifera]|uniref:nitric oxide dioxygenase n=1 Tax=Pilimelia columellifera subsp. columellifera TaxID=706583 RepID=A0ABP6AVK5_9ACTN
MLSQSHAATIQATLPAVQANGEKITDAFYRTLLGENPELMNLFSRSGQATGDQRRALGGAVAAFAAHLIDEPGPDAPHFDLIMERIAHKHASLGVRPDQYTVVGRYLMRAVGEVLGDAVTAEVAGAWDEVYWLFACRLIGLESRLYTRAGVDPEQPWREYEISHRRVEAVDTASFVLCPVDGRPAPDYRPGQYVTVAVDLPDGGRQLRQYSMSQAPSPGSLRITVRRVRGVDGTPDGLVSGHLHDHIHPGDRLQVSAPFGDLALIPGDDPVLLISAGVGITPMAAIIDHIAHTQPSRHVVAVHGEQSPGRHPLRADIVRSGSQLASFQHLVWYEEPGGPSNDVQVHTGLVDADLIPLRPDATAYLCGPVPFMRHIRGALRRRGLPSERIRYEVFGPDQWTATRGAR